MLVPQSDSLSSGQCRMARAALRWTIGELATRSQVSRASISRLENGEEIGSLLNRGLRSAFEAAGLAFTATGVDLSLLHTGGFV